MDGVVDIWDYFYRQNEVAYSHKVGDSQLSSMAVQGTIQSGGKLVAMGDVTGKPFFLDSTARKNIYNNFYKKGNFLFYTIIV
jgi:dynein intermediate chain 2